MIKPTRPPDEAASFCCPMPTALSRRAWRLLLDLYYVAANDFRSFVALRCQIVIGFRFVEGDCVVHAVPRGYADSLRRVRAFDGDDAAQRLQGMTIGACHRFANGWDIAGLGRLIDDFKFSDAVSLELACLGVQALHSGRAECRAGNHSQRELEPGVHDPVSLRLG